MLLKAISKESIFHMAHNSSNGIIVLALLDCQFFKLNPAFFYLSTMHEHRKFVKGNFVVLF